MDVVFVNTVLLVTIMFVPSRFGLVWIGLQWRLRAILISQETKLGQDPNNVTSEEAAAITDAVLTPYHAIKSAGVGPASNILIIGLVD